MNIKNNLINAKRGDFIMASFLINEEKAINDNIFKYEEKLNSPLNRFLDKSPIFVTYFHINNAETTADRGFQNTEAILGESSSLRFQKIENFPIYGIEQIALQLDDTDKGLDTTYNGEAVIVPSTVSPLQNDFFIINNLRMTFIFRINGIEYDSIRPDGYVKISYHLESTDDNDAEWLNKQCIENCKCIYQNIGSDNKCIIRTDEYDKILAINNMYDEIATMYISIYYHQRYNCFLGIQDNGYLIYDPLMSVFIDKHGLFNKKNSYSAIVLSEQFTDNKRSFKYENSVYRLFERKDITRLNGFFYQLLPGQNYRESAFHRWCDKSVMVVDRPDAVCQNDRENFLFCQEFIDAIRMNLETKGTYNTLIKKYLRDELTSLDDISLSLKDELMDLNICKESFFFTPIILYIISRTVSEFTSIKK